MHNVSMESLEDVFARVDARAESALASSVDIIRADRARHDPPREATLPKAYDSDQRTRPTRTCSHDCTRRPVVSTPRKRPRAPDESGALGVTSPDQTDQACSRSAARAAARRAIGTRNGLQDT